MTAITFPNSPSSGDTHTAGNGIVYTYDGEKWTSIGTNSAGTWTRSGTTVSLTNAGDDLNVDSGTLFVDASTDRVGIGTSSPSTKLEVKGGDLLVNNTGTGRIFIQDTDATDDVFALKVNGGIFSVQDSNDSLGFVADIFKIYEGASENSLVINSSGNVGIGTTSPGVKLDVNGQIKANNDFLYADATATRGRIYGDSTGLVVRADTGLALRFHADAGEKARLDTSGRLLVGTSSSLAADDSKLQVLVTRWDSLGGISLTNNQWYGHGSRILFQNAINSLGTITPVASITGEGDGANKGRLVFSTTADGASSPTERMRITSSGFTKCTSTGNYYGVASNYHESRNNTPSNVTHLFSHSATSGTVYGIQISYIQNKGSSTGDQYIYCNDSAALRLEVKGNGGIANYQSNNVNLCDEREKKNIETLNSTWSCLKNWELKKFHYNEDDDTDDKRYGVIAQQVAPHCPEVITEWVKQKAEDAVLDDDGNVVTPAVEEVTRMGVKEQQMMWMAIKALQEAQTRIETLEAKVAALEAS